MIELIESIKQVDCDELCKIPFPLDDEVLLGLYFITSEEEEKIVIDYYNNHTSAEEVPSSFFVTKGWYVVYNTYFNSEWGNDIAIIPLEEYLLSIENHVNFLRQAIKEIS